LQILGACSEQFTALLDDMLEIAWMDQPGRAWQLEPILFSPVDLLYEALDIASFGLTSEQRRLLDLTSDIRIQELPMLLLGDARRLRQVVVNLLQNAIKFTAKGEVLLSAGASREGDQLCRLWVQVKDTGVGIAPDLRDKLFQPFSQGPSSSARTVPGAGLGLYVCRRLIEAMKGVITYESEENKVL
jgi:two-component system sensor histidine kinase/response regulator